MTPFQLEAAARELCRLRGEDPDKLFGRVPVWESAKYDVINSLQMDQALAFGRAQSKPNTDNSGWANARLETSIYEIAAGTVPATDYKALYEQKRSSAERAEAVLKELYYVVHESMGNGGWIPTALQSSFVEAMLAARDITENK